MPITKVDGYHFHPTQKARILAQRQGDPSKTPWAPLKKPISECKVTLISTAGTIRQTSLLEAHADRAAPRTEWMKVTYQASFERTKETYIKVLKKWDTKFHCIDRVRKHSRQTEERASFF